MAGDWGTSPMGRGACPVWGFWTTKGHFGVHDQETIVNRLLVINGWLDILVRLIEIWLFDVSRLHLERERKRYTLAVNILVVHSLRYRKKQLEI